MRSHSIDLLEPRRLLSAAAVRAVAGNPDRPIIHELIDLARLPGSTAATLRSAGAAVWGALHAVPSMKNARVDVKPNAFAPLSLDLKTLRSTLAAAPLEFTRAARKSPLTLALPLPNGSFQRFRIVEAPIMARSLARQYSTIRTYRGQGVEDASASIRLDITPLGFHAQVLSARGAFYIDPYFHLPKAQPDAGTYVSYFKRDLVKKTVHLAHDEAGAQAIARANRSRQPTVKSLPLGTTNGSTLRTYRLAVAATGEYTQFFGGTVTNGLAAVVTAVNRVDGIYENELAVRLQLVANNNTIIYTNPATDPYANDNGGLMLGQNQSNLDQRIGNDNYDVGHVFSTGGGGIAWLRSVADPTNKAKGVTGQPTPDGDPFWVDYVAHELGHQFGANHTFNYPGSEWNGPTAYEPGSGSTIMGYAGITGSDDLQPHSDPYFHFASIDEILAFITTGDADDAAVKTQTGNTPPVVSAGSDYTIPAGTPFTLTASGSDADGDLLTYGWEESDLGDPQSLQSPDNGFSPLFRSFNPTSSPARTFRKLSEILANINTPNGEQYPATNRSLNFRVTARDNRAGGGGIGTDDAHLTVVNTGAAFAITNLNSGTSLQAGSSQLISWDVAGTNANGINVASVNILLSTDGGNTFPIFLASSTANDGSQTITLPNNLSSSAARIQVQAVGNIFFDINNANLTIVAPQPNGVWTGAGDGTHWSDAANWSNNIVPGPGDDVVIDKPGTFTVDLVGTTTTVHSLMLGTAATSSPTLSLASGGNQLLKIGALTINGAAKLDLNDNDLLLDYAGGSPLPAVQQLINTARASGAWTGAGLTSSSARTNSAHNTTLAALESYDYAAIHGGPFDGESPDDTAVLVKYTYYGDTDFNGTVNFDDYVRTDSGFNNHRTSWSNGDFDGNGSVNFDDYVLIDLAFNTQSVVL